jgi:hypothetical protein
MAMKSFLTTSPSSGSSAVTFWERYIPRNKVVTHPNKTMTIKTFLELKAAMMTFGGYFVHTYYPPPLSSLTWTLDYDRTSDFVDSVGYWHVMKLNGTHSRVFYSVNLMPTNWVPSWVVEILQKQALGQATSWVKFQSERSIAKSPQRTIHDGDTGGGASKIDNRNMFRCIWWSLYGDLLDDKGSPDGCDSAQREPQNTGAAASDKSWWRSN